MRDWVEGETFVFYDTAPRQARHDGDSEKVVLLVDFVPCPLALVLRQSREQFAADRADTVANFAEWHDEADLVVP